MKDENLTYYISDDYKRGIIAYHVNTDKERFEIAKKLDALLFPIKYANLTGMEMDNSLLDTMVLHVNQLEATANDLKAYYNGQELPQYIDFIVTHITENLAPGLKGFISQAKTMEMLYKGEEVNDIR